MKIKDMKVGDQITTRLPLSEAEIRQTKTTPPRSYLTVSLSDGHDKLDGKVWNYEGKAPATGKCYDITGTIGEYQGKKQITLKSLSLSENQSMNEFLPVYVSDDKIDLASDQLINLWREHIQDPVLTAIVECIYDRYWSAAISASSAKGVHHVGVGGNLMHTLEVAKHALYICESVKLWRGVSINRDLVVAGAVLHDIGKIFVYETTGAGVEVTFAGRMLEHHVIGIEMVTAAVKALYTPTDLTVADSEKIMVLKHIIASHHGKLEYGSPVVPACIEAHIVNMADGMSATIDTLIEANMKAIQNDKQYTDRIFTAGNREHLRQDLIGGGSYVREAFI